MRSRFGNGARSRPCHNQDALTRGWVAYGANTAANIGNRTGRAMPPPPIAAATPSSGAVGRSVPTHTRPPRRSETTDMLLAPIQRRQRPHHQRRRSLSEIAYSLKNVSAGPTPSPRNNRRVNASLTRPRRRRRCPPRQPSAFAVTPLNLHPASVRLWRPSLHGTPDARR